MRLTGEVDVSVGQRQQWGMQWVVAMAKDGVPLVDLLHHLRVQAVFLQAEERDISFPVMWVSLLLPLWLFLPGCPG